MRLGRLAEPFRSEVITWNSPLTVDAAIAALVEAGLRGHGMWFGRPGSALRGYVRPPRVVATRRTMTNNPFRPYLRANLTPNPTGSWLVGRLAPDVLSAVVIAVWASAFALAGVGIVIARLVNGDPSGLVALIMPTFAVGLVRVLGAMGKVSRTSLRNVVSEALACQPIDSAEPNEHAGSDHRPPRVSRPGPYTSPPPTLGGPQ